ncbi:GDSL-type esterase/lipase family protein [Phenylobacterium sp.]|jgi:acyl-CoA thioesterase-1|uniref:GDSL-type esterase/lipase family protein n=1 Tax=Phenylobacterium sp. TaxID=1871053 RepID=UPI002E36B3A1|nr:GDSL-type esterase/lipase family protein [Phenylobacterium sp.]HEX3364385.1 GDSL-type esterase/lipase family protein [Phenylobacterium sp.]
MIGYTRRTLLLTLLATIAAPAARGQAPTVVTLFGDSIAAGYGLAPPDGLASQLQAALAALGIDAAVRNAGVPGDTSPHGLARLNGSVRKDTTLCIVEFGGNDRRLGYPETLTRDSLDVIVKQLKDRGVTVILAGMGAGERGELYRQIAEANHVALYPDLFAGVGPDLRQPDGVHPNPAGAKVIARGLAEVVAEALRAWKGR